MRAVVWVNWGNSQQTLLTRSIDSAKRHIDADFFVVSDTALALPSDVTLLHFDYRTRGFTRKAEVLSTALPAGYTVYLFLDADTVVLDSVECGFQKAENFGLALSGAPTYLLDEYHRTSEILVAAGLEPHGQLMFNSGVMFFSNKALESGVFDTWLKLCEKHSSKMRGDQEILTIAIEAMKFNPWVLSKSYNTRGRYEVIIGRTRIWHQRSAVPEHINSYQNPYPPRLLARGKLRELSLKDTYGGTFRFLRANLHRLTTPARLLGFARQAFWKRNSF